MAAKKSNAKTSKNIISTAPKSAPAKIAEPVAELITRTEVRNSPVPGIAAKPAVRDITGDMIAKRAFEIFAGGTGGSEEHNWLRAERELRAGM